MRHKSARAVMLFVALGLMPERVLSLKVGTQKGRRRCQRRAAALRGRYQCGMLHVRVG